MALGGFPGASREGPRSKKTYVLQGTLERPRRYPSGLGIMDVTKLYKFIGSGVMDVTKPCEFIGFGAMAVTKPYEFIGFGALGNTASGSARDPSVPATWVLPAPLVHDVLTRTPMQSKRLLGFVLGLKI